MSTKSRPPVGTRVRARVPIHDDASNRTIPQHAKVGDEGVIWGYCGDDDIPTVDWSAGTGFGMYDTPLTDLDIYPFDAAQLSFDWGYDKAQLRLDFPEGGDK